MHNNCRVVECRYCARLDRIAQDMSLRDIPKLTARQRSVNKDAPFVIARAKRLQRTRNRMMATTQDEPSFIGRPPVMDDPITLMVRLSSDLKAAVRQRAREEGRSVSEFLRRTIQRHVDRENAKANA